MIDDRQLDDRLRMLAAKVDWPATVDVAPAVTAAVVQGRRQPARRWLSAPAWQPAVAALAIALLAFTAVLTFSPGARTAVARLLGFPGVAVEVTTEPASGLSGMDLGAPVSLAEAEARTGLDLRTLPLPGERVVVDDETGAVHIAYRYEGGRVALLTQLRGAEEISFLKQASDVVPSEVDGAFAIWATGPEHAILRVGDEVLEARLSENALLWAAGGMTYRLEIPAELPEAVRLAESLR